MLGLLLQIPAFAPTGQVDFIKLILEQILRVDPSLIAQYPLVQDKVLWLLLVPHVVLFLFLFSFAGWIVTRHAGLRRLLSVVTYLVVILGGYYGNLIVPVVNAWFTILLVAGLLFFLISRIFPPSSVSAATGLMSEAFGMATKGSKDRKQIETDIDVLEKTIASLERKAEVVRNNGGDDAHIQAKISDLEEKLHQKEAQLEKLGG